MAGAFACATIQQPKETWDQTCTCVFSSSQVLPLKRLTWRNEWSRAGGENHALGKCEWMQPREPAEGGGSLPCALTRNRASPNWNDFMLKGSSRLKSRQVSLSCPSVIFSIHLYTGTHSQTLECSHTQAFTHTFRALAALNQSPCPAKHLVQNAKGLDGF